MSTDVAVDNDVLHKLVMYDLLAAAQDALCTSGVPAVLGAARYVVGGLLERAEATPPGWPVSARGSSSAAVRSKARRASRPWHPACAEGTSTRRTSPRRLT